MLTKADPAQRLLRVGVQYRDFLKAKRTSETTKSRSLQISPKYTVAFWRGLELDPDNPKQEEWLKAVDVLRDRIQGRFIKPAQTLIDVDKSNHQQTYGFAILALDCLVLETIQGFREGMTNHTRLQRDNQDETKRRSR
ncbi:hypothetical protein [Rhizobium sp. L43]|uniref:hypothetical protein n=1 Tax=Rhizobium sp. L43 TaxID=2035452 RepID=UPI000BE7E2E6|nr:hypothetical protein [Rhizobium sp. L43]PDS70446.1 hypothetical protein CO667_34550 [Rhizobium sp. L43]